MPKRGSLGLDMMLRTCTVQVNLDFASEADMVRKFRVSLALQPVATALFANSPFTEGRPNGLLSYRSHIWTEPTPTAPACCPSCSSRAWASVEGGGFDAKLVEHRGVDIVERCSTLSTAAYPRSSLVP